MEEIGQCAVTLAYLTNYDLIYLATNYTKHPRGLVVAFREASELAGRLTRLGLHIFSPIAHSHPLALYGGIDPVNHHFWMEMDAPFVRKCDALLVAEMDSWEESAGIAHEITVFQQQRKPVHYLNPQTLTVR